MKKENDFELLAPAGCLDTLKVAVINGADAVYIGGKNFSARKNAANFTNEEIEIGVTFAHLHGAKVYVTLNILVHDFELNQVFEYIQFLYNASVDALIVQDLGVFSIIRKHFPGFSIHASTQMTVHNLAGARMLKSLGAKRVVLSRELSFDEIRYIKENCDIELEVFVHGALCMCYSGQCLMSSFLGCRSGNRGACAQPCRLSYTLLDKNQKAVSPKNKYLLSLKDLCLADEINMLKSSGVTSFKIEGRMKSSSYVATVCHIYNKYRNGCKVTDKDMYILKNIFSRNGFTKGYLYNHTGRDMLNFDKNNDKVYDNIKSEVMLFAENLCQKQLPKIPISAIGRLKIGEGVTIKYTRGDVYATVTSDEIAQVANNAPITKDRFAEQICKTGGSDFEVESCDVYAEDGAIIPIRVINETRRRCLQILTDKLVLLGREPVDETYAPQKENMICKNHKNFAEVINLEQARAVIDAGFDGIIVPYKLYDENRDYFDKLKTQVSVLLPSIMRDNQDIVFEVQNHEIYASNISQIMGSIGKINGNFTLNIFNSESADLYKSLGVKRLCLSPELNLGQLKQLNTTAEKEIVVYGRIPIMTVQNCLVKSSRNKCGCSDEPLYLEDRKKAKFPVFTNKASCTNTIYNSEPIFMADRLDELEPIGANIYRFIFTTETYDEIKEIFHLYKTEKKATQSFTRGHFYRGV